MCGIVGIVGGGGEDRLQRMRAMREELVHRGPDSGGEYSDSGVALGIRRLRVIDLATGDQPIANESQTVWTVFNGEIYNFPGLRRELEAGGHHFRTQADTEVIVHLYEDFGERCVERLEGMFALAIWDSRAERLVLARDRMGKKPLLYRESAGELSFASEHTALLAGAATRPPADPFAIRSFLRLGYVPAPQDAFSGVQKLPPAHTLVWQDGRLLVRRYWQLPTPATSAVGPEEAAEELRSILTRAVERRLIADVPVGAFLSGGVDSSAVVATMASLRTKVRTFTIAFDERAFSEASYAREVAELFGTDHQEFVVRPEAIDILPVLVRHYGEPYADSSAVPTYYLAKMTRAHVTVALNGDGGDEAFAGYERYQAARLAARLDRVPRSVRRLILPLAASLVPDSLDPQRLGRRARRFLQAAALDPAERYLKWVGIFDGATLRGLMSPEFDELTRGAEDALLLKHFGYADAALNAQLHDMDQYLPDDLLVKVDIASMANSLEVRSPFLDREMVEFAVGLPMSLKIKGGSRKYILKKAFDGILPQSALHRRKQGFGVPIGDWLRRDLRSMAEDTILSDRALARGYFRREALSALVYEHTRGRADHAQRLWALLVLELWHREFIDG